MTKKLIFFTADDNTTGRELYVMPANVAQLPQPSIQNHQDKFHELQKYPLGTALQFLIDNDLVDLLENEQ